MRRAIPIIIILIVLGFLASIAVPNLLTARHRSRQKRTMADLRTIATAWEARATDLNSYSIGGDDLERALVPTYIRKFPRRDGWGYEFEFQGAPSSYSLRSPGSDGRLDTHPAAGAITSFSQDLVFANGSFTQYPEGA